MNHPNHTETFKIYGVVLVVGIVCSLAIVSVYEATRPIIQRKQASLRRNAIFYVLPAAKSVKTFQYDSSIGHFLPIQHPIDDDLDRQVSAAFDEHNRLIGVGIETNGMGYQDRIRLLYGYSPDDQAIIGVRILESRETPGLGDRIETDEKFLRNFHRLGVALNSDATRIANPIEFVSRGAKTGDWQIDGITGATISSRAIAEMLGESTAFWIPRIHARRDDFLVIARQEP
jgi:electron transport complex protein RnfG